ncbi:hypothetical protein D3C86_2022160 [compost metagenome]
MGAERLLDGGGHEARLLPPNGLEPGAYNPVVPAPVLARLGGQLDIGDVPVCEGPQREPALVEPDLALAAVQA